MSGSAGSGSVLLAPYRSLGLVASASVRPHLKLLGGSRFLTVPLGRAWCVYNLDAMRVALMGAARSQPVRAIASLRDLTFTACGSDIVVWRRQEEQTRLHMHARPVYLLYLFGSMLCSVDEGQTMAVWDVQALAPAVSVKTQMQRATAAAAPANADGTPAASHLLHPDGTRLPADWKATPLSVIHFPSSSRISGLLHPSTYLNKLLVSFAGVNGGSGGGLELWNIKTRACIYKFNVAAWNSAAHNPEKILAAQLGRDEPGAAAAGSAHGTKRGIEAAANTGVSVTCMEQSPAVDCVAVGLHNGLIVLLNLRLDQVLHVYVHAAPSSLGAAPAPAAPISALSFRTDNHGSQLASTCAGSGTVAIWDLEKKQLKTLIKGAHGGSLGAAEGAAVGAGAAGGVSDAVSDGAAVTIHSLFFLPNEPLLLTVGSDNALKLWIFDALDGSARLLKERSGHALPPTRIRFYPSERGQLDILSAGADRTLRSFSLQKDEQSRELSQGSLASQARVQGVSEASLRLTQVVDFAASQVREREWSNIVSAHASDCAAYTWSWARKTLSKHKLLNTNPGATASAVKSVAMSACGNFGFLGMHNGRIDQFNVQSGTWKATFGSQHQAAAQSVNPNRPSRNINVLRKQAKEAAAASEASKALSPHAQALAANLGHSAPVTGLAVDGLNKQVVSASLDGSVLFWDFKKRTLTGRVDIGSPVGKMAYSQESDLLAVMDDAMVLHVLDAVTRTTVRRFHQHTSPLTDLIFSPDARWILTASTDCCVRIFDLASATLVDFMRFSRPVSSLSMSPRGDFVATTHVNNLGVYLWANKSYFGTGGVALSGETGSHGMAKKVARNEAIAVEVLERQDGETEPEGEEAEAMFSNVKQEDEEEEDEEDSDDEEEDVQMVSVGDGGSSKRQRGSTGSSLTSFHTPLLSQPPADQFDLITYSLTPRSQWHTLAHLDEIKARNAPREAVKAPAAAPFFLTALASLSNEKDGPGAKEALAQSQAEQRKLADAFGVSTAGSGSAPAVPVLGKRTVKSGGVGMESTLIKLLQQAKKDLPRLVAEEPNQHPRVYLLKAYAPVTSYLQSLSPPAIDAEVSALGLDPSSEEAELRLLLEYFLAALESQKHFEFVQAVMNRFLKVHGSIVANYPPLLQLCSRVSEVQRRVWQRLEEAFQGNLALVSHLAQIQL